ncbi:uncharacterized protein V1516DRAFT_629431 [Lipomyces oligophaga]|uniref:uncharacterized protein n=1 Tax=Lipomyces oligophaga TaxID=45792 RepID=UPI0034D00C7E
MQAPFSVPAQHSGKKGNINVSSVRKIFEWIPASARTEDGRSIDEIIVIPLDEITGLQASPASHAKARLRIMSKDRSPLIFELQTRDNLDSLKLVLSQVAGSSSNGSTGTANSSLPNMAAKGSSDVAKANKLQRLSKETLSDTELLGNRALQQNLIKSNPELQQQFLDAVVQQKLPGEEFWRTRVPLLRMHALMLNQNRGLYNVLASIRPVSSTPGTNTGQTQVKVSLSPDKIKDIFRQYPVVNKAYQDNVPPLKETEFWSRFFLSRLCRKLRGERISPHDPHDSVMDKYLNLDQDGLTEAEREREVENSKVMRFVDITGNEMDDSQKAGNQPDITMRQTSQKDALSIIRTFNELSQRIVDNVRKEADEPEEQQEQLKTQELSLQDLEEEQPVSRVELHLNDDSESLFASISTDGNSGSTFRQTVPQISNSDVNDIILSQVPKGPLSGLLKSSASSSKAIMNAQSHVFELIATTRHTEQPRNSIADAETPRSDEEIIREMKLSHATALEFLHHFWSAFLSGDVSRASSLSILISSVQKSKTRLETIINSHTKDKTSDKEVHIKRLLGYTQPTINALEYASNTYNELLQKQQTAISSSTSSTPVPE